LVAWARHDPAAALAALTEAEIEAGRWIDLQLVSTLAQRDPEAAYDWVIARPASRNRQLLLSQTLTAMARTAPRDALARAQDLRGRERENAVASVLGQWAQSDHRAAARWIAGDDTLSDHERDSALRRVLRVWGGVDATAALNWLLAQPQAWHSAAASVIGALADGAPESAARVVERLADPDVRREGRGTLARSWSQQDPRAALRWVADVADTEERRELYAQVFHMWTQDDRDAAADSIRLLRSAKDRDAVRGEMIQSTIYEDVEFAEDLYLRINDADALHEAAMLLYHYWEDRDPRRARRYQRAAGLEEEDG
jgi:hypothetical protein